MLQTLFHIPETLGGYSVFGAGLVLIVWAVGSVAMLAWLAWRQGFNSDTLSYIPLLLVVGAVIWKVLPAISEPGLGLPIRGYGVMMMLGVVSGIALAIRRGRQLGLDPDIVFSLALWGFVPGLLGARLFYIVEYWPEFQRPTLGATLAAIANLTQGGLVVYGALIGGMAGFAAYVYRRRLPLLATMDLAVPAMLVGLALGRVGCFLNGCCFGAACELPWAVEFPPSSPPHFTQLQRGQAFLHGLRVPGNASQPPVIAEVLPGSKAERQGLASGEQIAAINGHAVPSAEAARRYLLEAESHGDHLLLETADGKSFSWPIVGEVPRARPIHPTQLYSAIEAALLCLFLLAYDPFRRRDGELLALLLTLHPINRFFLEFIRTDEPGQLGTALSIGQYVSLLLLACAAALWIYIFRQPRGKAYPLAGSTGAA